MYLHFQDNNKVPAERNVHFKQFIGMNFIRSLFGTHPFKASRSSVPQSPWPGETSAERKARLSRVETNTALYERNK